MIAMTGSSPRRRAAHTTRAIGAFAALLVLPLAANAAGGLELVPDLTMLAIMVVLFLVMVFPVNALLFQPILKVLDEREARIEGTRTRAEQLEQDAQEALERYEASVLEVRGEAEQARRSVLEEARSQALSTTGEARAEVEQQIENARSEIRASLDSARETLRGQSQDLAREAASRVLGRSL